MKGSKSMATPADGDCKGELGFNGALESVDNVTKLRSQKLLKTQNRRKK